jgi:RNA polymerase sigma-70 factor (ECF subfamily)
MEYYRQESRAVSLGDQPDATDRTDLEEGYDSAHNTARVRAVLETLDPRDAEILKAVFLDDVDKDEICERFDIDRQYLRVLLHRAKAKFRAAFLRRNSGRRTVFETFGRDPSLPK